MEKQTKKIEIVPLNSEISEFQLRELEQRLETDPLTVGGLLDVGIGEDDDLYLSKPDCEGHCGGIFVCNSKS